MKAFQIYEKKMNKNVNLVPSTGSIFVEKKKKYCSRLVNVKALFKICFLVVLQYGSIYIIFML